MRITVLNSKHNIIVQLFAICKTAWYDNDDENFIKIEDEISVMVTSYAHLLWMLALNRGMIFWMCETIYVVTGYYGLKQNGRRF